MNFAPKTFAIVAARRALESVAETVTMFEFPCACTLILPRTSP